jgi:hypothetical protein
MYEYVSPLTASRIPIKAKSMADARICVNITTETTDPSNFTVLRHRERVSILNLLGYHLKQYRKIDPGEHKTKIILMPGS